MELLPEELLGEIFGHIKKLPEIAITSLVCKQWHRVIWNSQRILSLERYPQIPIDQFHRILFHSNRLQQLRLPSSATDDHIQILSDMSSLRSLSIRRCRNVTDDGLIMLCRLKLRELELSCSWNISSVVFLLNMSDTLQSLELRGCDMLANEMFIGLGQTGVVFPKLTELDLRDCVKISDPGIETICTMMPFIERLDVSGCNISFQAAQSIAKLKNLKTLLLWACEQLDDFALDFIAKLPKLQSLNLLDCDLLTDKGLQFISKSKTLTSLEVGSPGLSDVGIKYLLFGSPQSRLEYLSIFSSSERITDEFYDHCREQCPHVRYQHVRLIA